MNKRNDYNDSVDMTIFCFDDLDIALVLSGFGETASDFAGDPFQSHIDRTADMREEFSPAYNYSDDILRGLFATEEWCNG